MPDADDFIELATRCARECRSKDIAATLAAWAVELEPTEENLRLLTLYRMRSRQYDDARDSAKKLADLGSVPSLNVLALAETANFDYENALKHFNQGLASEPDLAPLYANRAHVRLLLGDFQEGAADVVRALVVGESSRLVTKEYEPDLGEVKQYLRHVERTDAKPAEADPAAWRTLRVCATMDGSRGELYDYLLKPLVDLGDLAWVHPALRAVCWKTQDDWDEEIADLRSALDMNRDDPALLARLWSLTQFYDGSEPYLAPGRRLIELYPGWMKPRWELARTLHRTGRDDESLAQLELVLQGDNRRLIALLVRAEILRKRGDLSGAIRDMGEVIELTDADKPEEYGKGEREEGIWEIEQVLTLAELYSEQGEENLADLQFEKALAVAEVCDQARKRREGVGPRTRSVLIARARHCRKRKRFAIEVAVYDRLIAEDVKRRHPRYFAKRATAKERAGDPAGAEADRKRAAELKAQG